METLISTNISSLEIIIGKMFAITGSAVITAIFSTLGFIVPLLIVFLYFGDNLPEAFFNIVAAIVNPVAILGIFSLNTSKYIHGSLIASHFSLFKESQRGWLIIGQCDASIFCPSLLAFNQSWFRDRHDWGLNPCYSLALHTNALIAENINWMLYGVTLGSTVLYS